MIATTVLSLRHVAVHQLIGRLGQWLPILCKISITHNYVVGTFASFSQSLSTLLRASASRQRTLIDKNDDETTQNLNFPALASNCDRGRDSPAVPLQQHRTVSGLPYLPGWPERSTKEEFWPALRASDDGQKPMFPYRNDGPRLNLARRNGERLRTTGGGDGGRDHAWQRTRPKLNSRRNP